MDEDHSNGGFLETGKADRSVWLMKCPVVVAKSWKSQTASSSDSQPVAKVVLSLDPRKPDDPSSMQVLNYTISSVVFLFLMSLSVDDQFTMEMAGSEIGNIPKNYALNMFKDFVPMSVFSETTQGKNYGSFFLLLLKYSFVCYLIQSLFVVTLYGNSK
ncbi:hypothetical protein Gotri_022447 [Gossypium trilobum]|uniref:TFIIF beta subunit N-terminal domain-containing protein n=1 Tax=Gossypium trilobum TaxID=34281 RepID=A0A7J9DG84_9ROSI|nr:hypothetical protein [Gossypium trilobum]